MKEITEDDFYSTYKPIKNHLVNDAGFNGCLFETYGEEFEYIKKLADTNTVWTIREIDDGDLEYVAGFIDERDIGYYISEIPYKYANVKARILLDMN